MAKLLCPLEGKSLNPGTDKYFDVMFSFVRMLENLFIVDGMIIEGSENDFKLGT